MSNNYAGIDYAGFGSTVNRDVITGIRYGVISQRSIQGDALAEILNEARDLNYEQAVEDAKKALVAAFCNEAHETEKAMRHHIAEYFGERVAERCFEDLLKVYQQWESSEGELTEADKLALWEIVEQDFNDRYEDNGERSWLWEKDGYALQDCLQSDVFVTKSPYFTYAAFCSPCVPGAGNLDSPFPWNPVLEPHLKAGVILQVRLAEQAGVPKSLLSRT